MSLAARNHVWINSTAEGAARLVLLALAEFANDSGECFPGVETLAARVRYTTRYVQRVLRELTQAGEITIQERPGTSNLYRIVISSPLNTSSPGGEQQFTGGVNSSTPLRGEQQFTGGVNSSTPDPSFKDKDPETSDEPPLNAAPAATTTIDDPPIVDPVWSAALEKIPELMHAKNCGREGSVWRMTTRGDYWRDRLLHLHYRAMREAFAVDDVLIDVENDAAVLPLFMRPLPVYGEGSEQDSNAGALRATLLEWATEQLIDPDESASAVDAVIRDVPRWTIEEVMARMKGKSKRVIGTKWFYFEKCLQNERGVAAR